MVGRALPLLTAQYRNESARKDRRTPKSFAIPARLCLRQRVAE